MNDLHPLADVLADRVACCLRIADSCTACYLLGQFIGAYHVRFGTGRTLAFLDAVRESITRNPVLADAREGFPLACPSKEWSH